MTRFLSLMFLSMMLALSVQSCSKNELYDDMPQAISSFISQYYPNSALASFSSTSSGYTAVIKDGPGITFAKDCSWTAIDGYGSTIPQVFLFNELPPAVFAYLQETENVDSVFAIKRDSKEYTLKLLSSSLTYDIATGQLSGSSAESESLLLPEAD